MDEEYIKAIHAAYGEDKLGSYDDFYSEITSNKDYRDLVYNQLGGADVFGEYTDFEDLVSIKQEDSQKKKTSQPYQPTSEEPTEVSKTDSESIDLGVYPTAFTPEEDIEAVKTSSKAKGYGLQDEEITKGRQAGFVLEKVDELSTKVSDWDLDAESNPDVFAFTSPTQEQVSAAEWGPTQFYQGAKGELGEPTVTEEERRKEYARNSRIAFGDDKYLFVQKELEQAKPELDKRYQELSGYDREEFIVEQPDGSLAIDPNALTEVQFFSDQFAQAHKEEVAKQEERYREKGRLGRGAGLVGQGFENLYYGVEGWFDPEDAAANTAFTGAKLEGAKRAMGLSEEEIQGGVIKNIGDGKVGSALTNLYAGVMSNIPQIAVGVASSYVGMPNVGMATLGASAGGAKYAQIYDNPNIPTSAKYLMAAQVAVTETLTERLAMGDINAAKAAVRGLSKAGRKELALRTAKNFIQEAKIPLKVGTEEAIEEGIAGGAEALMDNLVTGEPIDMYSIGDAMAIGFASGSGTGSAKVLTSMPSYVGSYKTANRRRKVLDSLTKLREAQNDPNVTQDEIDILQKSVDDAKLELVKIAAEDQQLYDKMSNEDVESIIKINRQIARGLDKLETISNDRAKSALKSQLQNLHKEKGNIEGKYRAEQAPVEQAESAENTVRTFAERIAKGEDVSSAEDIQFYENNKQEVEDALRQMQEAEEVVTETVEEQPTEMEGEAVVEDVQPKSFVSKQEGVDEYDGIFSTDKTQGSGLTDPIQDDVFGRGYFFFKKDIDAEIVMMSPDEYIKRTEEGFGKTTSRTGVTEGQKKKINKAIDDGNKIDMPYLDYRGNKFSQEGRNRAIVAKERGETMIPVLIARDVTDEIKNAKIQEIISESEKVGMDIDSYLSKYFNEDAAIEIKNSETYKQYKQETDAVLIEKAGEVPVQPEAEVSGEMEEGVPDTEPQEATQEGKKPRVAKDKKGITSLMERVFGLNKSKSKAAARIYDIAIGTIAERAGITKEEVYRRFGFVKGKKEQLKGKGNVLFQSLSSSVWESTAKRGIEAIKQNAATPEQWVKMITDKGGKGTSQELEWIGLSDFLNDYVKENGVKSVPRDVVEQYINDNQIEIVEVGKGGSVAESDIDALLEDEVGEGMTREEAREYLSDDEQNTQTKYSEYTLEGGENYREVLLTLPTENKMPKGWSLSRRTNVTIGNSDRPFNVISPEGKVEYVAKSEEDAIALLRKYRKTEPNKFQSSHFDEANILAHLRINERTLPNGERVMFIEEVQSDWAQEGKKKGFISDLFRGNFREFIEQEKGLRLNEEQLLAEFNNNEGELKQEFLKRTDRTKTPDMPYKKTDQWVGMAMRRVFKMAADEGFNRVAWVTGEQSADRYDLSKQIGVASAIKNDDGTYNLVLEDTRGDELPEYRASGKKMTPSEMEDIIGKELAQKLIEGADRNKGREWKNQSINPEFFTLRGNGLKVGGEGMKAFYNSILPKVAKKEAQRFDKKANVEVVEINQTEEDADYQYSELSDGTFTVEYKGDVVEFETEKEAEKYIRDNITNNRSKQLSIAITPEMRMNLNSAIPLFQGEQGAMVVAEDGNYIIYALTDPNVSTPLHELAHVYEHYLTEQERADIEAWSGHKSGTVEFSEAFARGFEKYLADGKAPNDKLQKLFDNFKKWLTEIYDGITGSEIDLELNDKMRGIYDAMLEGENKETARRRQRNTIKEKIDKSVVSKLPFLAKFNPEHSYTVAQAELIDKFIDEYVKTGSLKGSGNVEALINGVSNMASLKQKAKTGVRKIFFGNSFDAKALSLIREMSGKTFISKIFATGFEKVTSAIGMVELDEALSSVKRDSSNWINKVKKDVDAADTSDVDSRGDVKMFAVGFVEQIYQRFSKDVGEERAIQLGIRMLELSIETQFNTKINREKINIQREALELIKNETTIEGILSKLTDGQRAVYEKVIEQNSQDIDKIEEISMSNGNPLERQNRYLHIPTITVDTGKNKLDLTPEEFSKDPNAIGYINPFNDKIFEITSGAQEARVKDINNLLKSFESGSVYLKPSFILEQHNSFFNTRLAIYTHKAIMQLNAALGAKESYEVFGGLENSGAENIDALKSIIKNNLNVNRISAYTLDVLPVVGNVVSSIKRNAISFALGSVVQPIKQGTVIATTIVEVGDLVGRSEAKDLFVRSMTFVYDYGGEKIRSKKEADDFQFKNLPWGKLISKAPVSVRNTLDALEFRDQLRNITIISSFAPARTARGGFRKIRDYSLSKSLVTPDRASAQVGWLNLYEAYMIKNGLLDTNIFYDKNGDFMSDAYRQWYIEQGNNPNNDAIAYASTRVLEYQGPSTEFERSMLQGNVNLNNEALNFIAKYTKDILLAMQSFSFGTSSTQTSAIVQLLGNNFTKEDKAKARVRLGGIAVGFALFNAIGLLVYDPLIAIAKELIKDAREYFNLGDDEEEEYELNEKIKTLYKNPEDFRRALSRSLTNWTLESTVPFLSQGNAGKYALATGMDFIYYSIMNGIYGEEMKKTYGEFGSGGFTVWQQSSQMRPQAYKPKDGFDLGYYTILPEDAYELYKVFNAGITGEYVDNYDNTYYLTEEQRKEALRIGGFMSFGYAVPAFPATTSKMGVDMFRGIVYEASDNYLATWSEDFKALPDDRKKELQEDFARNLNKYYQEQYKQILAEYGDEYISSLKVVNEVVYDLNDYSFTSQLKHLFAAMDGKEKASEGNIDAFLFNLSNRNITPIAKGNIINQRLKKFDDKKERNEYYGRFVYSGLFLYNMDELRAIMNHVAKLNEGGNDSK